MSPEDAGVALSKLCRALSADSRVRILRLLGDRTLCVGALSNALEISAAAVSQHLRVLREAGIVAAERRGCFMHYRLVPGAAERCVSLVESVFEQTTGGKSCAGKSRSARGPRN